MVHFFDKDAQEYADEPQDSDFADTEIDETEGSALEKIKNLKEKLRTCEKERKDYLDGWQRSKADYLNSKRRYDEERTALAARIEDGFIERLLPLCDSFDMAATGSGGDAWEAGFKGIHAQLRALLTSMDVTEIAALGEDFDPRLHEALKTEVVDDADRVDTVVAVLQKGYMRKDRLIRPAKVVIGASND